LDKGYVRGQLLLWDAEGNKYLDLLTGWRLRAGPEPSEDQAILTEVLNAI